MTTDVTIVSMVGTIYSAELQNCQPRLWSAMFVSSPWRCEPNQGRLRKIAAHWRGQMPQMSGIHVSQTKLIYEKTIAKLYF